jgi:hypothetical protein
MGTGNTLVLKRAMVDFIFPTAYNFNRIDLLTILSLTV